MSASQLIHPKVAPESSRGLRSRKRKSRYPLLIFGLELILGSEDEEEEEKAEEKEEEEGENKGASGSVALAAGSVYDSLDQAIQSDNSPRASVATSKGSGAPSKRRRSTRSRNSNQAISQTG